MDSFIEEEITLKYTKKGQGLYPDSPSLGETNFASVTIRI